MSNVIVKQYSTGKLLLSNAIDSYRLMSMLIIVTRCSTPSFFHPLFIPIANKMLISRNVVLTSASALSNSILDSNPVCASHRVTHTEGDNLRSIRQTWTVSDTTHTLNDHPQLLAKLEGPTSTSCLDVTATDRHIILHR
jgi:hypothetical protein